MSSLAKTIADMLHDNSYSPDISYQESKFSYIPIFVYGTQMQLYSDHSIMGGFPRIGIATTVRPIFTMYKTKTNEPVVLGEYAPTTNSARVRGELYVVPPSVMFQLDSFTCRGVHFYRRKETVRYIDPKDLLKAKTCTHQTEAWMYIGFDSAWLKSITSKTAQRLTRLIGPNEDEVYYRFTMEDDKPNRDAYRHVL